MERIRTFGQQTFSSLKIRNYRLYFFGQGISQCGSWIQTVAMGWLVLQLSGSGTQLGFVLALQFIPLLFAAPWGGIIVDRLDKRKILYRTQSAAGVLSLIVSLLVFTGSIQMWMLYVIAFLIGIVKVFDNPARQTFISEMVGNDHVKNAVSLNSTMGNLARAIGPTLAGLLIVSVGIPFCFLIDGLSYIAVLITLVRIDGTRLTPRVAHKTPPRISDGFRYVRSVPLLSSILIMMAVVGTFAYEFSVSLPLLAQQTFSGNATTYAALTSAFGAGSAIGGLFAANRQQVSPRHLIYFTTLFGLMMLAASLSPTLSVAIIAMFVVGFFSINVTSLANTTIQLESKPEMRGRVMALWNMAIFGSTPIGGPIIGYIGEHLGARWGVALGGAATMLAAGFAARTLLYADKLRTIPASVELEAEEVTAENGKF